MDRRWRNDDRPGPGRTNDAVCAVAPISVARQQRFVARVVQTKHVPQLRIGCRRVRNALGGGDGEDEPLQDQGVGCHDPRQASPPPSARNLRVGPSSHAST